MIKKKGVQNIIRLAPLLLERDENLLFVMIGDGPLRERLEKKGRRSRVIQKLLLYGESSQGKSTGIPGTGDIFALPSINEAFRISILEAISKKVPVVQ